MKNIEPDTEKRILAAATKVFMLKGRLGASMQDIADQAGINRPSLHYYFRNKERLFDAIFNDILAKVIPVIAGTLALEMPLLDKLELFLDRYIGLLEENPFIPVFIFQEISINPDRLAGMVMEGGLQPDKAMEMMRKELELLGMKDMDPRHLLANLMGMVVFPYIGRPLFQKIVFADNETDYNSFLLARKKEIPRFLSMALSGAN